VERREAANALTLWRGFGAFCEDVLKLDVLKVLTMVMEPGLPRVEDLAAMAERLELELSTPRRSKRCVRGWRGRGAESRDEAPDWRLARPAAKTQEGDGGRAVRDRKNVV